MSQSVQAQTFINVMRICFVDDKDRLVTPTQTLKDLRAGKIESDAMLNLKDAQVLSRTCRDMPQLMPDMYFGNAIQAATRLKKISRLPVSSATMALNMVEMFGRDFYKEQGSPTALSNVLLALNKSRRILTSERYDYAKRGIAMAWFAMIADVNDTLDGSVKGNEGKAVFRYRNLDESRRYGAHYLVKNNFREGTEMAVSFGAISGVCFTTAFAVLPAAKMTGYKTIAAKAVFGASAAIGVASGLIATAAVYGTTRNIYKVMTASPDVWLSDWYRDAFLF